MSADWVPMGRADLQWVADDSGTGTLVGEEDGLLRPPLTLQAGPLWGGNAVLIGLGVARFGTTNWTADERTSMSVMGIRPSADYRRYLLPREEGGIAPYAQGGVYGVLPVVRYTSDVWSEDEQEAMTEAANSDRARIGGVGVRAGLGVELLLAPGVGLGARWLAQVHRQQGYDSVGFTVSTIVRSEAALTLSFTF